ncbi:DUF3800 domain-containing protein [Sphingomonas sp. gentR]|uniref:DUF3800 domain-containing protein n=1 Tax=unclassified Sphingomonas TaxID=196159 RepID=UPI00097271DF|nr:DUF3800 domain-containing protein [Sphingomonas sp. LK11]APX65873.1 hypothetical protein AV944_08515 [Sphingomonas sp. LK11]
MFAYVDETGNTGARLLDADQPLFITAALMTRSDFDTRFGAQVRELARRFDDDELHASKLGVCRLEEIAPDLLSILRRAGPSFFASVVEKRYVLGTKAFHTLLDPAENRAIPTQVFLMRPVRMTMAFKFAWLLDEEIAQLFWDALMEVNASRAREKLIQFCGRVLERVERLPDARSREVIGEGLAWAMANPEAIDIFSEDKVARQGHLPNTVGFGNLLAGVETQSNEWGRPVEVIRHDRQSEFAASLAFWHDFYANAGAAFIDMPLGERAMLRRVFGSRLEITSARDSAGIQVTDVILWLLSRSLRGQDLPAGCQSILDYARRRGRQNVFTAEAIHADVVAEVGRMEADEPDSETMARASQLYQIGEDNRRKAVADYAAAKGSSA